MLLTYSFILVIIKNFLTANSSLHFNNFMLYFIYRTMNFQFKNSKKKMFEMYIQQRFSFNFKFNKKIIT